MAVRHLVLSVKAQNLIKSSNSYIHIYIGMQNITLCFQVFLLTYIHRVHNFHKYTMLYTKYLSLENMPLTVKVNSMDKWWALTSQYRAQLYRLLLQVVKVLMSGV